MVTLEWFVQPCSHPTRKWKQESVKSCLLISNQIPVMDMPLRLIFFSFFYHIQRTIWHLAVDQIWSNLPPILYGKCHPTWIQMQAYWIKLTKFWISLNIMYLFPSSLRKKPFCSHVCHFYWIHAFSLNTAGSRYASEEPDIYQTFCVGNMLIFTHWNVTTFFIFLSLNGFKVYESYCWDWGTGLNWVNIVETTSIQK